MQKNLQQAIRIPHGITLLRAESRGLQHASDRSTFGEGIIPPCCTHSGNSLFSEYLPDHVTSVDLRTSVIILESNDKKIQYYSKAIISCSVCAITGEYGIDFLINYAITYIFASG